MIKDRLKGFKEFILRGNAIDLAIGVVIGAGFSGVVNAFVKDIVSPLIGSFVNISDFANLSFTVNGSRFLYGDFINALLSFVLIAAVVYFFVITPMHIFLARMGRLPTVKTKECPQCLSDIPLKATRCAHCTQPV